MRDALDAAYACMIDDFAQHGHPRKTVDELIDGWHTPDEPVDDSEALDDFMGQFGVSMADLN